MEKKRITITRKELSNMTTDELYDLASHLVKVQDLIKAELILRGDY